MDSRKCRNAALVAAMTALGMSVGAAAPAAVAASELPPAPASPPTTANQPADTSVVKAPVVAADRMFARKALQGGLAEVEMGNLAQSRAQSEQVKSFGARMAKDHASADDKLKQVASVNRIELPAAMDPASERMLTRLKKLQGAQFDVAYMDHMVADHKKDVKEFEHEAKSDRQNEIKQFAADTLPTLREHLALAQSTQAAAKNEARGSSALKPAAGQASAPAGIK